MDWSIKIFKDICELFIILSTITIAYIFTILLVILAIPRIALLLDKKQKP